MLAHTMLFIVVAVLVSRVVDLAASGGGQALVAPLAGLMAALAGTAVTVAWLPRACLRLERAIVLWHRRTPGSTALPPPASRR